MSVLITAVVVGAVLFIAYQIRDLRRWKRNQKHWERDEPLEGVGEWD